MLKILHFNDKFVRASNPNWKFDGPFFFVLTNMNRCRRLFLCMSDVKNHLTDNFPPAPDASQFGGYGAGGRWEKVKFLKFDLEGQDH